MDVNSQYVENVNFSEVMYREGYAKDAVEQLRAATVAMLLLVEADHPVEDVMAGVNEVRTQHETLPQVAFQPAYDTEEVDAVVGATMEVVAQWDEDRKEKLRIEEEECRLAEEEERRLALERESERRRAEQEAQRQAERAAVIDALRQDAPVGFSAPTLSKLFQLHYVGGVTSEQVVLELSQWGELDEAEARELAEAQLSGLVPQDMLPITEGMIEQSQRTQAQAEAQKQSETNDPVPELNTAKEEADQHDEEPALLGDDVTWLTAGGERVPVVGDPRDAILVVEFLSALEYIDNRAGGQVQALSIAFPDATLPLYGARLDEGVLLLKGSAETDDSELGPQPSLRQGWQQRETLTTHVYAVRDDGDSAQAFPVIGVRANGSIITG